MVPFWNCLIYQAPSSMNTMARLVTTQDPMAILYFHKLIWNCWANKNKIYMANIAGLNVIYFLSTSLAQLSWTMVECFLDCLFRKLCSVFLNDIFIGRTKFNIEGIGTFNFHQLLWKHFHQVSTSVRPMSYFEPEIGGRF